MPEGITCKKYEKVRLDFENCLFAVTQPTQLWRCWLKIFCWTSKSKKKNLSWKTFPKATDYFNVKFYFSNARLNSVEHIYYFPQQKNLKNRCVVSSSKAFCFLFNSFSETFWNAIFVRPLKTKRFMNIFSWICFKLCLLL